MFRTGSASIFLLFVVFLLPVVVARSFDDYDDDDDDDVDQIQPEVVYEEGRGFAGNRGVTRRGGSKREAPRFTVNQDLMSLAVMLRREAQRRMVEQAMQKFAEIGRRRRRGDWGYDEEAPSPSSSSSSASSSYFPSGDVIMSPYE